MPSIAVADEDKAKTFAETLVPRIILQIDDQGKMRVGVRPYTQEE